jgi:glycolate oxidase
MNKLKTELLKKLDSRKVIFEKDVLAGYAQDETSDLSFKPDILVRAENASDVQEILILCSKYKIPLTPRGGGTGVTGGAVPVKGGLVLSLEKMNKIIEIDKANMVAVVEPGVILADLQEKLAESGLMYPPDPASFESCSIGGNVAENAGGAKAVKYGVTKDYILGLEFVLPNGEVIQTGGKFIKNATGYNLTGLLLGSEGTLAIITKIFLKLIPLTRFFKDFLIPFISLQEAIESVNIILASQIQPTVIEFMEEGVIKLVAEYGGVKVPFSEGAAYLLIQFDGNNEDYIWEEVKRLVTVLKIDQNQIIVAETKKQRENLWKIRRSIRESIKKKSPIFFAEDSVLPRSEIPKFVEWIEPTLAEKGVESLVFGHAGDGNLHINILKNDLDYQKWLKLVPEIKKIIYKKVVALGGTISGEHGIGFLRKDYLSLALSKEEIELSKKIKGVFDPDLILNPNKIF